MMVVVSLLAAAAWCRISFVGPVVQGTPTLSLWVLIELELLRPQGRVVVGGLVVWAPVDNLLLHASSFPRWHTRASSGPSSWTFCTAVLLRTFSSYASQIAICALSSDLQKKTNGQFSQNSYGDATLCHTCWTITCLALSLTACGEKPNSGKHTQHFHYPESMSKHEHTSRPLHPQRSQHSHPATRAGSLWTGT